MTKLTTGQNPRIRVALLTLAVSPVRGSECAVSWNYITRMSRYVDLTVIYPKYQQEVEQWLADNPLQGVKFINVPIGELPPERGIKQDLADYRNVRQWHRDVMPLLRRLVDEKSIDLIHMLNPIGFKQPGKAWKIKEVPYVWGPMMCVENRPFRLYHAYPWGNKLKTTMRRLIHNAYFILSPWVRRAIRNSDVIFSATPNGVGLLRRWHGVKAEYLPENGIVNLETSQPLTKTPDEPLRLIWVGRVDDPNKALVITLDALARTKSRQWHLDVVGKGEISSEQRHKFADILPLITFHGAVSRAEVQQIFKAAHLHIISSMGEATTTVLWEAMAKGIPTMTLDHCGMAGVVCEHCGIKIPIDWYGRVTQLMAENIDDLILNPERINALSKGALECSKKWMWDNRVKTFLETYNRLTAQYASK